MRSVLFASIAVAAFAATPAFAQSSGSSSSQQQAGADSSSSQSNQTGRAMTQQKLRTSLEQAGFQNVTVLDAAYLVEGTTKDGDHVVMMINPPMTGMSSSGSGSAGATASGSGDGSSGSGGAAQQDGGSGSSQ